MDGWKGRWPNSPPVWMGNYTVRRFNVISEVNEDEVKRPWEEFQHSLHSPWEINDDRAASGREESTKQWALRRNECPAGWKPPTEHHGWPYREEEGILISPEQRTIAVRQGQGNTDRQ